MARKKPEEPCEVCVYCEQDVPCVWTVKIGAAPYAMCKDCAGEATKDFFSFCLRTPEDREKAKNGGRNDSDYTGGE